MKLLCAIICLLILICQLAVFGVNPPAVTVAPSPGKGTFRIGNISRVQSARENQLLGYGLVVGLNGTGDSNKSPFTLLAVHNILRKQGIVVDVETLETKNVAAVIVTAAIGPFLKSGDKLDISVSSLGDAVSLQGGTLLQVPLLGADNCVYAVAQGSVSLGGFSAGAGGASITSGFPTVGRIPGGALIEREIPINLAPNNLLVLSLNKPNFTTAANMAKAITADLSDVEGKAVARNAATVELQIPQEYQEPGKLVELIARIDDLTLTVNTPAKIIINERTGTVVITENVTITPVAVASGNLSITVNPAFFVSQPFPRSEGETVVETIPTVTAELPQVNMTMLQGSTVEELVRGLNLMKATPNDIINILLALKQAGAIQAEIEQI